MAEHVQQVGSSQESGEVNFHDDWTCLAPSINEILKEDHLMAALESLDTDVKAVPLGLPENLENYFELDDPTNSLWTVPDVVEGNQVPMCENITSGRKDSSIDQDDDADELNLSYNANSCSQVSLDAQEDANIIVTAADLFHRDCDSVNIAFQTKDRESEADSLQIDRTENSRINSSKCNKTQYKNLSDTISQNSFAETLNTDEVKERELSCKAGKSEIIQEEMKNVANPSDVCTAEPQNSFAETINTEKVKERELSCSAGRSEIIEEETKNVDDSSDVCSAEKQNIVATKPNAAEEHTHSEGPVKYKPQFGNKKRKLPLSKETGEKQSKVETATKSVLAVETCSVKVASAENDSTTIADETAVAEDNRTSHSSTESISVKTAEAATSDKSNKDSSTTNDLKSTTGGNESLSINDNTAKFSNKPVKSKGKPSTCGSGTINESDLTKAKNSKTTSESVSRKGKKSTTSDSKLGKGKAKASKETQNSTIATNSSLEKEETITGIKHYLEQQESLASARNMLRCEKQKNEYKSTEMSAMKEGFEEPSEDTVQNRYEEKVKTLDGEVSLLETLIEQVRSLTEGEEDPDKSLSLFGNIREKVSASLLLKYPVLVAVLEPIQRYEIDERIKKEAEDIYKQFKSMYIKQNMEDFVFTFDRMLKFHHRRLAKSERLAQKILKKILPDGETKTELTFDIEMWSNLAKERNNVWDRFVQEFREPDKTTMFQAASGCSSPTSNIKEEVEELNNYFNSTVLNTMTQEQQETGKSPQPSCNRTSRKGSHSLLKSNPKRAETIVKPEHGVNNDANVKPASNKLSVRIKEEPVFNPETLNTNKEMQRKQPTRSCKIQNIKGEVSIDEPIITVKQEICCDTEIVNIKEEMQQKQIRRSSKSIIIKEEVISGHDQIVRFKKEIDSDTDIKNTNRDFLRMQPRRSCKPNKGKLELRMHFTKRQSYFNKEKNQMSKKAKVSGE